MRTWKNSTINFFVLKDMKLRLRESLDKLIRTIWVKFEGRTIFRNMKNFLCNFQKWLGWNSSSWLKFNYNDLNCLIFPDIDPPTKNLQTRRLISTSYIHHYSSMRDIPFPPTLVDQTSKTKSFFNGRPSEPWGSICKNNFRSPAGNMIFREGIKAKKL